MKSKNEITIIKAGFSTRAVNCISELYFKEYKSYAGFDDTPLSYLCKKTEEDLISLKHLGHKTLTEIVSVMRKYGLKLKSDISDSNSNVMICPSCYTRLVYKPKKFKF